MQQFDPYFRNHKLSYGYCMISKRTCSRTFPPIPIHYIHFTQEIPFLFRILKRQKKNGKIWLNNSLANAEAALKISGN